MHSSIPDKEPNRPVLFMDSGLGGLPYCRSFSQLLPEEAVLYLADRAFFPYGPKRREQLSERLVTLVGRLRSTFNPKLVVIACNSASVSALDTLRNTFTDLPFVGTVPAIKPAVEKSQTRRIGIIATERTIKDPYTMTLIKRYGPDCKLVGMEAPDLVDFVEQRFYHAEDSEKQQIVDPYVRKFREKGVDSIVLGCTHYLFLTDYFVKAARDDIHIFDSLDGVAHRIQAVLQDHGLTTTDREAGSSNMKRKGRLLLTGSEEIAPIWSVIAADFNLVPEVFS